MQMYLDVFLAMLTMQNISALSTGLPQRGQESAKVGFLLLLRDSGIDGDSITTNGSRGLEREAEREG
jgi:hypothetical protein